MSAGKSTRLAKSRINEFAELEIVTGVRDDFGVSPATCRATPSAGRADLWPRLPSGVTLRRGLQSSLGRLRGRFKPYSSRRLISVRREMPRISLALLWLPPACSRA